MRKEMHKNKNAQRKELNILIKHVQLL